MSEVTREGLKKISSSLGDSFDSIDKLLGDLNKDPKVLLNLESVLCKLRGSTFFYNEDYRTFKYTNGSDLFQFEFAKSPGADNVNFGMQGAFLTKNYSAARMPFPALPVGSTWNPGYYGPPCTEGFGVWEYNAWKGYEKASNGELQYDLRYESEYPVRLTPNITPYSRVAYFEHARWISIYNNDAINSRDETDYVYVFELDKNLLDGIQIVDPLTDLPKDLRFMFYNKLLQKYVSSAWQPINVSTNSNLELSYLAHQIEDNGDSYLIKINIPSNLIFDPSVGAGGNDHQPQTWWHFIMYWGSKDPKVSEDVIAFDDSPPELLLSSNYYLIWNVKHFFTTTLDSKITWTDHAINDSSDYNLAMQDNRYLVANNRTHFELVDGGSNVLPLSNPYKYKLYDNFIADTTDKSVNSISNIATYLDKYEYQSAILMCKTYGIESAIDINTYKGLSQFKIKLGPKFPSSEARFDWENFQYYPEPDLDYFVFARMILKRADSKNYNAAEVSYSNNTLTFIENPLAANQSTIYQNVQIIWIEQVPPSFAIKPLGDDKLIQHLLPALYSNVLSFRNEKKYEPIVNAATRLLVMAARIPTSIADTFASLNDPDNSASIIFRKLLKNPIDPLLQPKTDEPLAFQFPFAERKLIEQIVSKPPSTEMLRLNADNFYIIENKINIANTFEIYHEPSEQCTAADNQNSGNKLSLDYTLRLHLEDENENVLKKDWFLMASKYYITKEEYNNRVAKEQSTVGYFTEDTISQIDEWRLHGYAGIVPDLRMGSFRVLTTRFENPPDSTKMTREQFIANLEAQNMDPNDIDEAVRDYIDQNGEFYEVSLFQYGNKFTRIREASINITTLTEGIPIWKSNISGVNNVYNPDPTEPVGGFYSDSFTISLQGASGEDLEAFGSKSSTIYSFTPSPTVPIALHNNSYAFKFNSGSGGNMTSIVLKLKATLFEADSLKLSNEGAVSIDLYATNDTGNFEKPGTLLTKSLNTIAFSSILDDTYTEFYWEMDYELVPSTTYWVVLSLSAAPQGGNIELEAKNLEDESLRFLEFEAFSFFNLSDTNTFSCFMPIKINTFASNLTSKLTNSTGTLDILIYDSDSNGNINQKLSMTSANYQINFSSLETYEIIFNFSATVALTKDQKYWVVFLPSERPRGGTISVNLNSISLTPGLYSQNLNDNNIYTLWDNWNGQNYKAWMKVTKLIPEIYGYFNRETEGIKYFPPANTKRIVNALLSKESSWAFTIKKFPQPSVVYIYPRYPDNEYVRFFNKIYVCLRLMVGGKPKDYFIELDPATSPVVPIAINSESEKAESIVYMYVAKTMKELENGYHGAEPGDRLVLRSS